MHKSVGIVLGVCLLFALAAIPASADTVVLTFEGLQDYEPILEYYNGGSGGSGSGPGPNYGISFGSDALALIDADAGGSGNFANEPTPDTIAFFLTGPGVVMNVPGGFEVGFSFFYTSVSYSGSVTVYDGLDGTGNVLAVLDLVANGSSCGGDPSGDFNCWTPFGVNFNGVAKSVNFGGVANQIGFDNITLGSEIPGNGGEIPEPGTMLLAGSALLALALVRRVCSKAKA